MIYYDSNDLTNRQLCPKKLGEKFKNLRRNPDSTSSYCAQDEGCWSSRLEAFVREIGEHSANDPFPAGDGTCAIHASGKMDGDLCALLICRTPNQGSRSSVAAELFGSYNLCFSPSLPKSILSPLSAKENLI